MEVQFLCNAFDDTRTSFHVVFDAVYIHGMVKDDPKIKAAAQCKTLSLSSPPTTTTSTTKTIPFCATMLLCALQIAHKLVMDCYIDRNSYHMIMEKAIQKCGYPCACLNDLDDCIDRSNRLQRVLFESFDHERLSILSDLPTPFRMRLKSVQELCGPQLYRIICDSIAEASGRSGIKLNSNVLKNTVAYYKSPLKPKQSLFYVCADFK